MTIVQRLEGKHPVEYCCAQAGCKACLESLLQQNEGLIHYMVRRQYPGEADYSDLIQEGRIGLWQAILHYEAERGYAFSSLAGKVIRNRVWNAVKQAGKGEGWLEERRAGDSLTGILAVWQAEQLHQALEEELGCLPESLREVIELAYGLDGQAALSLAAIGRQQGLTRERVRQKRDEALGWLGLPTFSVRLRGLYEQDSRSNYRQARRQHDDWRRKQRGRR